MTLQKQKGQEGISLTFLIFRGTTYLIVPRFSISSTFGWTTSSTRRFRCISSLLCVSIVPTCGSVSPYPAAAHFFGFRPPPAGPFAGGLGGVFAVTRNRSTCRARASERPQLSWNAPPAGYGGLSVWPATRK